MRSIRKIIAVVLPAMLCICGAAQAMGVDEIPKGDTLEGMFSYVQCLNPEIQEQQDFDRNDLRFSIPGENSEYVARLMQYAGAETYEQTVNGLKFTAKRSLGLNGLCALEWTLENVSDGARLLDTYGIELKGVDPDKCAGRVNTLENMVLLPGEARNGVEALLYPEMQDEKFLMSIVYDEYEIAEAAIPDDRDAEVYPEDVGTQYICSDKFSLEVERSEAPVYDLLADGGVYETEWNGSTLRVTEAYLSLGGGSFTALRIFDSEEQARANNPCDDDGWDIYPYCAQDEDGEAWIAVGGGSLADEPVQLEDGRWAYTLTHTADFLNWMPENICIAPSAPDSTGQYVPDWSGAIEFEVQ